MADMALAALLRAWNTTAIATVLLVAALTLFRIWDSALPLPELPSSFQPADYSTP